ncbi:protein-glutamine glutaminase family protein [Bdellovibrio bacteriovorus]|uniref:protein-glutamine glutaminase family protein n=1 Tax=Bdellovibrio bacteriovorus TaxID=959 RepID=UPI0021CF83E0|nr:protein-glutamine glutaminase family protein [Bdellovibrio bacteriovorus]UXR66054.1 protein-glutamine glutaminase family protein [Bdellovibrio bacteriovorus]
MAKAFFITILFSFFSVQAADDLSSFVTGLDSTLRHLNSQQTVKCDSAKLTQAFSVNTKLNDDRASVMSEKDAQKLFNELKANGEIPFEFSIAGCEERAHEMSRLMLLKGITPIKVFASVDENESPRLRRPNPTKTGSTVEWKYHVAPAILVKKNNELIPYVLDPSLEKKAVPVSEWQASMTRHNPKMKVQIKFTPAAQFDDRGRIRTNFKDNDFNNSIKETLREHKARSKNVEGEDQYWFELQRNEERMMMFDEGGY